MVNSFLSEDVCSGVGLETTLALFPIGYCSIGSLNLFHNSGDMEYFF